MANLGPWRPDLPEHGHDGLVLARNVYYSTVGYKPIKTPSEITTALSYTWLGGGAFTGVGGSNVLICGTTDGLYTYSSGWTKKYPAGAGSYSLPFHFVQFGDLVIAASGSNAPIKYTIATATGALLGGSPPNLSMLAVIGGHVFGAGNSSATSTIYSSALENAESWTIGTGGADSQQLPDGGEITGLSGGEYGLVFQESAITMVEPTDAPIYWTTRKVSKGVGSLCAGSVCAAGRDVGFYSRDGFKMWREGQILDIGRDAVDLTFAAAYTEAEIKNNLRSVYAEKSGHIIWSMPDRLWLYDVKSGNWSDCFVQGAVGVMTGKTASVTLETIAVTYPAIESVTPGFDDPYWQGGQPMLLIAKSDKKLYTFGASTNMEAQLRLTKQEIEPGRWATIRAGRPTTDATSGVTLICDTFARLGDSAIRSSSSSMQSNGEIPILATGHYVQGQVTIAEGTSWTFCSGLDLVATGGGSR